jgi:hypothetical protein
MMATTRTKKPRMINAMVTRVLLRGRTAFIVRERVSASIVRASEFQER